MNDDDKFFERLRGDAAPLRYQVDDVKLARIRARIHERLAAKQSVAEVLAAWFRPLAAGLAALALAAAISMATVGADDVSMELTGDTYVVDD
jgi:translation elongation factor EF-1beta